MCLKINGKIIFNLLKINIPVFNIKFSYYRETSAIKKGNTNRWQGYGAKLLLLQTENQFFT